MADLSCRLLSAVIGISILSKSRIMRWLRKIALQMFLVTNFLTLYLFILQLIRKNHEKKLENIEGYCYRLISPAVLGILTYSKLLIDTSGNKKFSWRRNPVDRNSCAKDRLPHASDNFLTLHVLRPQYLTKKIYHKKIKNIQVIPLSLDQCCNWNFSFTPYKFLIETSDYSRYQRIPSRIRPLSPVNFTLKHDP